MLQMSHVWLLNKQKRIVHHVVAINSVTLNWSQVIFTLETFFSLSLFQNVESILKPCSYIESNETNLERPEAQKDMKTPQSMHSALFAASCVCPGFNCWNQWIVKSKKMHRSRRWGSQHIAALNISYIPATQTGELSCKCIYVQWFMLIRLWKH